MKNILFVSEKFPYPVNDGGNLRTYNILKGLSRNNKVTLLAHAPPDNNRKEALQNLEDFCTVVTVKKPHALQQLLLNTFKIDKRTRSLYALKNWSAPLAKTIDNLQSSEEFDTIHFNHLDAAMYSIAHEWPQSCVFDSHNCLSQLCDQISNSSDNIAKRHLYRYESNQIAKLEKSVTDNMDITLVCSTDDADYFHAINPEKKYHVVANGVDTQVFMNKGMGNEEPGNLVFTGSMNYFPNEQAAIYFCEQVLPLLSDLDLRVYFVGIAPGAKVLQLADEDRVFVTGMVDEVQPYVERAELFIVPLKHGSGTRLKILEAFSMNKAVVTTSVGIEGIPAVNGEHAYVADEPEEFATRIRELLNNKSKRIDLGKAARDFVCNNYDWKIINDKVALIYRDLETHS